MTLEEYKDKVRNLLEKMNISKPQSDILMKDCEKYIQQAYKENWKISEIAIPMSMNLI